MKNIIADNQKRIKVIKEDLHVLEALVVYHEKLIVTTNSLVKGLKIVCNRKNKKLKLLEDYMK